MISITGVKHLPAVLAKKNFSDDPISPTFSVEPLVIYNCAVYNWKLSHYLWDIRLVSIPWPWNPGQRSLKVIGTDTDRSATYNVPLTFHSNHGPISHRFRDRRRFPKIANFPTPVYIAPWKRVSAQGSQKTRMMGLSGCRKSSKIGLAVLIQYRRVTDTQPACHPATLPWQRPRLRIRRACKNTQRFNLVFVEIDSRELPSVFLANHLASTDN